MKQKQRVPKGEKYWCISRVPEGEIREHIEQGDSIDDLCYKNNNYFHTKEEAEAMARKLRAVLAGADVIEMPSEEEFYEFAPSTDKLGCFSLENRRQVQGFQDCWDWIKSKIVK